MAKVSIIVGAVCVFLITYVAAAEDIQRRSDHSGQCLANSEEICDENTLTFPWYDGVKPQRVNITGANTDRTKHLAEDTKLYREVNGTYKLGATDFQLEYSDSIALTKSPGFVETVFYAYQQHHNLIIRPDDIWTAIMIQFSLYVTGNAEALRHAFVNHVGKETLVVQFRSRIDRVNVREFITKMGDLIAKNDPEFLELITPNFTTTTENDRLTAGVAVMATLQEFFDYELYGIICGIPEATILGTVDDWENIYRRLDRLTEYEIDGKTAMAQWQSMLRTILEHFVKVKKYGTKHDQFWRQAIRVDYRLIDLVCAKINETTLNGWLTTFTAFNLAGKWRGQDPVDSNRNATWPWLKMRTDKLTPGTVHVPIKIRDEYAAPGEQEYTAAIITGHMGYSVKADETTIQPVSGYIMMVTNDPPSYMKNNVGNDRRHGDIGRSRQH